LLPFDGDVERVQLEGPPELGLRVVEVVEDGELDLKEAQ
jgi:hypothetical protein